MRTSVILFLAVLAAGLMISSAAQAGGKIQINDESYLDLGFRMQFLVVSTQSDLNGDEEFESTQDMKVRRARFRLKLVVNDLVEGFLQTDVAGADGGVGRDMRVIDAYGVVKPDPWAHIYAGINMVPASRQNVTSSGALMAIDRPGINYKTLSWGTRSRTAFTNGSYGPSDSGIRGEEDVRDAGVTLFGAGDLNETAHLKYYAGMWDGIQRDGFDRERFSGRAQINFFDAEPGYYNSSTYLGKKKTVGIGASFDTQNDVAEDENGDGVDYTLFSFDGFAELPFENSGSLTLEGGVYVLDFGDAMLTSKDLMAVQGTGFYGQGGFLVAGKWQPWVAFETWASDRDDDLGSYKVYRVGVNHYFQGQNANVKLGLERFEPDVALTPEEDSLTSIVAGLFLTY